MSNTNALARTSADFRVASPSDPSLLSSKLQPWHWERQAVVDVRQSSPQQVLENRESMARQYVWSIERWPWMAQRVCGGDR